MFMNDYSPMMPVNPMPRKTQTPMVTLFFPGIGKEITLCRQQITIGRSKFRDLDLSQFSNARYLEAHHATLYFENSRWYLRVQTPESDTRINDRKLNNQPCVVYSGDYFTLGGREVIIIRHAGVKPIPTLDELGKNIHLGSESIHLTNGHVGSSAEYDAKRRVIIYKKWGIIGGKSVDSTPQETKIPDSVVTEEDLYNYAGHHLGMHTGRPEKPFDQDVLLWLSSDCLVQFVADRKQVLHRKWAPGEDGTDVMREDWLRMTGNISSEKDVWAYARRCWVHIPINRKHDLDEDIQLSYSGGIEEKYIAESRTVVRKSQSSFSRDRIPEETLSIPEHITEHNELLWYIAIHRHDWSKFYMHSEEMFHDMVLSSGRKKEDGRRLQYETVYLAESRTVVHHVWDLMQRPIESPSMKPLKIPYTTFRKKDMLEYVWKNRPEWK